MVARRSVRRRSAEKQAAYIVRRGLALGKPRHKNRNDGLIHSIGTGRAYQQALTLFCRWIQNRKSGDLFNIRVKTALEYLDERKVYVGQKTIDRDRQAVQFLLRQTGSNVKLQRVFTTYEGGRNLAKESRGYTQDQVNAIAQRQSSRTGLATRIAYTAGLRAHELLTIQPKQDQPVSSHRNWSNNRFSGRDGKAYTVVGKGGLIREIRIPTPLAIELEKVRFTEPRKTIDRNIIYYQHYDVSGGMYFSHVFSKTSKAVLGWSVGAHGLRHGYAQDRMSELLQIGYSRAERLEVISQELGHFRPGIVTEYLR